MLGERKILEKRREPTIGPLLDSLRKKMSESSRDWVRCRADKIAVSGVENCSSVCLRASHFPPCYVLRPVWSSGECAQRSFGGVL
jgi:hypothetical protein